MLFMVKYFLIKKKNILSHFKILLKYRQLPHGHSGSSTFLTVFSGQFSDFAFLGLRFYCKKKGKERR